MIKGRWNKIFWWVLYWRSRVTADGLASVNIKGFVENCLEIEGSTDPLANFGGNVYWKSTD